MEFCLIQMGKHIANRHVEVVPEDELNKDRKAMGEED